MCRTVLCYRTYNICGFYLIFGCSSYCINGCRMSTMVSAEGDENICSQNGKPTVKNWNESASLAHLVWLYSDRISSEYKALAANKTIVRIKFRTCWGPLFRSIWIYKCIQTVYRLKWFNVRIALLTSELNYPWNGPKHDSFPCKIAQITTKIKKSFSNFFLKFIFISVLCLRYHSTATEMANKPFFF